MFSEVSNTAGIVHGPYIAIGLTSKNNFVN